MRSTPPASASSRHNLHVDSIIPGATGDVEIGHHEAVPRSGSAARDVRKGGAEQTALSRLLLTLPFTLDQAALVRAPRLCHPCVTARVSAGQDPGLTATAGGECQRPGARRLRRPRATWGLRVAPGSRRQGCRMAGGAAWPPAGARLLGQRFDERAVRQGAVRVADLPAHVIQVSEANRPGFRARPPVGQRQEGPDLAQREPEIRARRMNASRLGCSTV